MTFVEAQMSGMILMVLWHKSDGANHRSTYQPGDDISGLPQEAQDLTVDMWTPEKIAEWLASQEIF